MSEPVRVVDSPLSQLIEHLACPICRGGLEQIERGLSCNRCRRDYPVVNGIAVMSSTAGDSSSSDDEGNAMLDGQIRRDLDYAESGRRIRRQRHELHIVTEFLSELPGSDVLLDLGCRGGRFSGPMQSAARLLVEADRHLPLVQHAVEKAMNPARVTGLVCEMERLPFANDAVDGSVCVRLSHRIEGASRRERLLHEILRVSSNFVLFSFSDAASLPNLSRKLRFRAMREDTMHLESVVGIAAMHGARIEQHATVSPLGTRHRFVALVKAP